MTEETRQVARRVAGRWFDKTAGYYRIQNESPEEVARRYVLTGDKIRGGTPHAYYSPRDLWPLREYTWTRETSRAGYGETGQEKWDRIRDDLLRKGWNPKEPLYLLVGKNGQAKVGEGNHRLAIAMEIGLKRVPVVFDFRSEVSGGHQIIKPPRKPPQSPEKKRDTDALFSLLRGGSSKTGNTLDHSGVKQLRSDFRRLTKIYRDIPSQYYDVPLHYAPEEFQDKAREQAQEAREIFKRFRNRVRDWVYHGLGVDRTQAVDSLLLEATADFIHDGLYLDKLFPIDRYTNKINLGALIRDQEKNIRRYQKYWRAFYQALDSYVTVSGGEVKSRGKEEVYQVSGVTVIVDNTKRAQYEKDGSDAQKLVDAFLQGLEKAVKAIRKAGFSKALEGLKVRLEFEFSLTLGQYVPEKDILKIFSLAMSPKSSTGWLKTLIHEIGHRYYFRKIDPRSRAYYEDILSRSKVVIERRHVDQYINFIHYTRHGYERMRREKYQALNQLRDQISSSDVAVLQWIIEDGQAPGIASQDEYDLLQHMKDHIGKEVPFEYITEYGNTHPWEAYAESFLLYVTKGPRSLRPFVREVFERVSRLNRTASVKWTPDDFFRRHPRLREYSKIPVKIVSHPGAGSHPYARYQTRGYIELYPKWESLDPATKDFAFAHEIGHHVESEYGLGNLMKAAQALGIDPWDVMQFPFGQMTNISEAFADCFASYYTDGSVKTRYPLWTKLVEQVVS